MENRELLYSPFLFKTKTMATNKLSLNIPDIMTDCILRIEDTSVYEPLMPYNCPTVQVMVPGFSEYITLDNTTVPVINKNFILNLTACNLNLQSSKCGEEYNAIPDGVYTVKYSLQPHDRLYVEYNHLRVTAIKKLLQKQLCDLNISACEPTVEVMAKFNSLMKISGYIEAAKAKVEYCHNVDQGMVIYNYAKKLLDKFSCQLF